MPANPQFKSEARSRQRAKNGRKSMVSVNEVDASNRVNADKRRIARGIALDEGCTCPKPLYSVLNICSWCIRTKASPFGDPLRSLYRVWMENQKVATKRVPLPLELRPFVERSAREGGVPSSVVKRMFCFDDAKLIVSE